VAKPAMNVAYLFALTLEPLNEPLTTILYGLLRKEDWPKEMDFSG